MKKRILSIFGVIMITALMVINAQFMKNPNNGILALPHFISKAQAVAEEEKEELKFDAEYPECEWSFTVNMVIFEITKTVKGSYRVCTPGFGLCVWGDPICGGRIEGIRVI
jgi:hypothetical protein